MNFHKIPLLYPEPVESPSNKVKHRENKVKKINVLSEMYLSLMVEFLMIFEELVHS